MRAFEGGSSEKHIVNQWFIRLFLQQNLTKKTHLKMNSSHAQVEVLSGARHFFEDAYMAR